MHSSAFQYLVRTLQLFSVLITATVLFFTSTQATGQDLPKSFESTNHSDPSALEIHSPGFNRNVVANNAGAFWRPTSNPQSQIVPGKMRSDYEAIPGGFTKEEADLAEIQEAQELLSNQREQLTNSITFASNCRTYWPSPHQVCGAIREKYDQLGGPQSFLTWPKSNELTNPDGTGKRTEFVNGFIYWHPVTGAHSVSTHFSLVWARNGWETGRLGYPIEDELGTGDGIGRRQVFQNGHIYGSLSGLAAVEGEILGRYLLLGGPTGVLGYPETDEIGTPDGVGRFNRFAGGMLYWSPTTGAWEIHGLILALWSMRGYERSEWGYPTSAPTGTLDDLSSLRQSFNGRDMFPWEVFTYGSAAEVHGKEISSVVLEYHEFIGEPLSGYDNVPNAHSDGETISQSDFNYNCPKPDSTHPSFGSVSIPDEYRYWGCNPWRKKYLPRVEHISLHDYCTTSPDAFNFAGVPVNMHGACARHDLCLEALVGELSPITLLRLACDKALLNNMMLACHVRSQGVSGFNLGRCRELTAIYFAAVAANTWLKKGRQDASESSVLNNTEEPVAN